MQEKLCAKPYKYTKITFNHLSSKTNLPAPQRVQYRYRLRLSHLLGCVDLTWERSGQKLVLRLEGGVVAVMTRRLGEEHIKSSRSEMAASAYLTSSAEISSSERPSIFQLLASDALAKAIQPALKQFLRFAKKIICTSYQSYHPLLIDLPHPDVTGGSDSFTSIAMR